MVEYIQWVYFKLGFQQAIVEYLQSRHLYIYDTIRLNNFDTRSHSFALHLVLLTLFETLGRLAEKSIPDIEP